MLRRMRGESGATIMEVVVSLAVGGLLVAGVLSLIERTQMSYMHSSEATDLQQNLRVGIDRVTRLIQVAGVNPKNLPWGGATANDPAFTAFREAGRNCIRLYADLNGDGDLNVGGQAEEADENVYFHWSTTAGGSLMEQRGTSPGQPDAGQPWVAVGTGSQKLADGLAGSGTIFRYFTGPNDPDGAPGTELFPPAVNTVSCATLTNADRSRISRVVITMTGAATVGGPASLKTLNKTLTSDARARNVP